MSSFFGVSVLVYLLLYVYLQTETAPGGSAAGPLKPDNDDDYIPDCED